MARLCATARLSAMRATARHSASRLRSLSTSAPTAAKAEAATEGRGPWTTGALVVTGLGAASAGTWAYVCSRYIDDSQFRSWMRKDLAAPSRYVEKFISDYMPRSSQALRIEDDLEEGGADVDSAGFGPRPRLPGSVILGGVPAPERISEGGRTIYSALAPAAEGGSPATGAAAGEEGGSVEAPVLAQGAAQGFAGGGEVPDLPLGPMPPDEAEPDAEPGPLQWWAPREDAARVWASAAPPSDALRLAVPHLAAERFEAAMRLFEEQCQRLFEGAGAAAGLPSRGGAAGETAGGTGGGVSGLRVISLPEGFTTAPAVFYELADKAAGADPASVRRLRLQWLRVQEAFTQAESEALAPRAAEMRAVAQRGEGGGIAHVAMELRMRQLAWRLSSLAEEKKMVKRGYI